METKTQPYWWGTTTDKKNHPGYCVFIGDRVHADGLDMKSAIILTAELNEDAPHGIPLEAKS